ncbi:MAG: DUF4214 domain-containing protein [Desulfurella sp.]|uniref:DUF4214 domain-containing protein n=1 Tax=Desulfurella sp. TaxID=1962857 RepID=UPI003D127215
MAFTDYFNQVQELYIAYYQRPADPAGLIYWSQMAAAQGGLTPQIINAFANSPEAQANYGTITSANIAQVITSIYEALFNRAPDPQGLAFYEKGFKNGTFTPGTIALNILNGAQGSDAVTLQNKLTAAMQFTQAIDPALYTGSASQLTATYDAADIAAAKAYLSSVTADPSTLPTQNQTSDYIASHIAQPGDTIIQTSTNYYEFTTGIDHLQGSGAVNIFEGTLNWYYYPNFIQAGDTASGPATSTNTLQIYGNDYDVFQLNQLGLTNIQNVVIYNDEYGLDFSGTSGISNLTSNNPYNPDDDWVEYTLNGQNATINGASGEIDFYGKIGNVVLANDSGDVYYYLENDLNTAPSTQYLTINTIGKPGEGDDLETSNIATLNLNVSGKNYVNNLDLDSDGKLLNISGAANASLNSDGTAYNNSGTYIYGASALTTLNISGAAEVYLDLTSRSLTNLATVNAANDTANLHLNFASDYSAGATLASGFTFTGGTSPTTELTFSSSQLSTTQFGTIKPGSGNNILGINDSAATGSATNISSTGALTNAINTKFSGFHTLDILTNATGASPNYISANLLTSITTYNIDNAGSNIITGLTSSKTVNILDGISSSTDTLSASGANQTLHLNIGDSSTQGLTIGALNTNTNAGANPPTTGFDNVLLNSYGSGTGVNTIKTWNYAGTYDTATNTITGSTTNHTITIGGNYDLSIGTVNSSGTVNNSGLVGYFGSTGQASALNITNVFDASQFSGASQTRAGAYHLNIVDSTQAIGSSEQGGPATTVNNLFIAPTNTTMSLIDNTSVSNATVNVYFDVHNAQYGNLSGGLVDKFVPIAGGYDYLLFDANASGSDNGMYYGTIKTVTVTGNTLAADLQYIDTNGKANTLYQFTYGGNNYIVDTGASTSTINDDIVVLIGNANAAGSVTDLVLNSTHYHAVQIAAVLS